MSLPEEVLQEFLGETDEMLDSIAVNLGLMEKGEHNQETLKSLYRELHTIKGSAQLFGFKFMGQIAHSLETLMDPVREELLEVESSLIDLVFSGIDIIKKLVAEVQNNKAEPDAIRDVNSYVPKVQQFLTSKLSADFVYYNDNEFSVPFNEADIRAAILNKVPSIVKPQDASEVSEVEPKAANTSQVKSDEVAAPNATSEKKEPVASSAQAQGADSSKTNESANTTIRVGVGVLDNLMNLIGELVLIRNQFFQYTKDENDAEFVPINQRLNLLTADLQDEVMKTRMQPVGNILSKFERVVRDLSKSLDKKVELIIEGAETELDKALLEAVKDPLTHIVRNSLDHGLETPSERLSASKPAVGKVVIKSYHESGQVVIEISDDGRGLSREKIEAKAIEKGIVSGEEVLKMSDREVQALIFDAGFSTAEKVTSVSGRGVGMDVVKTNIEKIGGMIDIDSVEGKGTSFKLRIPLTLAIIPALVVRCEEVRYAIPQVKLVELINISNSPESDRRIEFLQGAPVYRLRGDLIPLVDLTNVLGKSNSIDMDDKEATYNMVVSNSNGSTFGLIVDEIVDSYDIVVKPLSGFMKNIGIYSGATVMGDGSVVLTLDVNGISDTISNFSKDYDDQEQDMLNSFEVNGRNNEYLKVRLNEDNKYLIPMQLVERLETVQFRDIETSGRQLVLRYRGALMPLFDLESHFGDNKERSKDDDISVVVCNFNNVNYGFMVQEINDVVTSSGPIRPEFRSNGLWGGILVGEELFVVISLLSMIETSSLITSYKTDSQDFRNDGVVLYLDSNHYFRTVYESKLNSMGYRVKSFQDAELMKAYIQDNKDLDYKAIVCSSVVKDGFSTFKSVLGKKSSPKCFLMEDRLDVDTSTDEYTLVGRRMFSSIIENLDAVFDKQEMEVEDAA